MKYFGSNNIVKLQYNKIFSGRFHYFDNFAVLKHVTNYVDADVRYVKWNRIECKIVGKNHIICHLCLSIGEV